MTPPVASNGCLRASSRDEAIDLVLDVDELALIAQPALLEVLPRRAQVVELLRELRLGADHLQLEVRVLERDERLAGRDERALLDVHGRDLPAFDGVEVDRGARHDVARDGDVLAKRVVRHPRYRDSLGADGQRAVQAELDVAIDGEPDERQRAGRNAYAPRRQQPLLDPLIHGRQDDVIVVRHGLFAVPFGLQDQNRHRLPTVLPVQYSRDVIQCRQANWSEAQWRHDAQTWDEDRPIYRQLMEQIVSRIIDQTYREGELLPSVRQIASDFLVNPLTVARAYRELGEYTETRRGIGLIVKEGVRDLLLRREQKRFLRDEWPLIRERIKALDLDPKDLLK